jgi:hypothetical protein
LCAKFIGSLIIPWAVVGTKNHIRAAILWNHGIDIIEALEVELFELIITLDATPKIVAIKAAIFK